MHKIWNKTNGQTCNQKDQTNYNLNRVSMSGGKSQSDDESDFLRHIYSHIVPNYKHTSSFISGRKDHLSGFLQCYCCRFCRAWVLLLSSDVLISTTKLWTLHETFVAFLHHFPRTPFHSFHRINSGDSSNFVDFN